MANSLPVYAAAVPEPPRWRMPVAANRYDRSPLTGAERDAMSFTVSLSEQQWQGAQAKKAATVLERLARPLQDVADLQVASSRASRRYRYEARSLELVMYREMLRLGEVFWRWSVGQWLELIGTEQGEFAPHQPGIRLHPRSLVRIAAYLLGGISDLRAVGLTKMASDTADIVFGPELITQEVRRVKAVLVADGYSGVPRATQRLRNGLALIFLLNRSPHVEHLGVRDLWPLLDPNAPARRDDAQSQAYKLARALWGLGIFTEAEYRSFPHQHGYVRPRDTTSVAPEWLGWCRAWHERAMDLSKSTRDHYLSDALGTGRWLAAYHPEIVSPEQWDEELADAYVAHVCNSRVGDDFTAEAYERQKNRVDFGKPLKPNAIDNKLGSLRRIFGDWQDKPHAVQGAPARRIAVRLKPGLDLRTPQSIRRLMQPDPRDIDQTIWWKLMRAAATLTEDDLGPRATYPLAYVSAVALLWVTSARRPNEIARLRVGCIRREWDPQMLDESGWPVEQDAQFTYLHVPPGKTRGAFWIPIPSYVADAVESWESERPSGQPPKLDDKDNTLVNFLFCSRGTRLYEAWINRWLIPLLCRKAGVPEQDARGTITAHRGRSTMTTLLRKAGVPLDDLSDFLGHSDMRAIRHYARTDPFSFARTMRKADDLLRIVEGVLDPNAAAQGKPAVFFYLGYGPEGRPRFCANPAWESCPHRLGCLQCEMYVDAEQAQEIEQRDGVIHFEARVPMLAEEKALADGDDARMHEIVDAKQEAPTPTPPGPDFVFNSEGAAGRMAQQGSREALQHRLDDLKLQLAAARESKDGRNAVVRSLQQQISSISERLATLDRSC